MESADEFDANRHPIIPDSDQYKILRAVYDLNRESGENTVTLTLVHSQTGTRRTLRFTGVNSHPMNGAWCIYVLDTRYRQWEGRVRVEVGEGVGDDRGVYFQAESVEEVAAPPTTD